MASSPLPRHLALAVWDELDRTQAFTGGLVPLRRTPQTEARMARILADALASYRLRSVAPRPDGGGRAA